MKQYLETGKIVSTHGVQGEVKVLPWADSPEFLTRFRCFYFEGGRLAEASSVRVQNTCVLIKFNGVDTVEQAEQLRGKVLSIRRDDPAIPAGTVFIADLVNLPVLCGGKEIGKIKEVLTMPSSDVWVVKGEHEYMIPAVPAFVKSADPADGFVEVNLIEGMRTDEN